MKIAFIAHRHHQCGVADYSLALWHELKKMGDVQLFMAPDIQSPESLRQILQNIQAFQPDLVHIQYHPDYYGFWRLPSYLARWRKWLRQMNAPIVITVHDIIHRISYRKIASVKDALFNMLAVPFLTKTRPGQFLLGGFLNVGDFLITHSDENREFLKSLHFNDEHLTTLYPGIPEITFSGYDFKKKYGTESKIIVSMFGFIRQNKGFETVVDALRLLPPNYIFMIGGDSVDAYSKPYKDFLVDRIHKLQLQDRVIITGYLDEKIVPDFLKQSDVVVFPYLPDLQTGVSYAVNYAIAAKRPIVVSQSPYFTEVKKICPGLNTFTGGDAHDLARAIQETVAEPSNLESLRQKFIQDFSWSSVARKTWAIYQQTLQRKNANKCK